MKNTVLILAILVLFAACGDDNGTKVSESADDSASSSVVSSSSKTVKSSSSKTVIQSGGSHEESSNSKKSSSSSLRQSSANLSSSSKTVSLSSSSSSKTVIQSGDSHEESSSSSSKIASSSSKIVNLSSSAYKPYDHSQDLAHNWNYEKSDYKTFVDPRNGRSYYYITVYSAYKGYSVTVMAENLNIGEMVLGENDQNDDSKIERYCYNNDTTRCDIFGGLYQWAEMMQLPSRCNTESCAELIQENHRGICPEGWRLFTYDDYTVVAGFNDDRIGESIAEGLRSQSFSGYNTSGFSLIGGGTRNPDGKFYYINEDAYWAYPQEYVDSRAQIVHSALIDKLINRSPGKNSVGGKEYGYSVRCTKLVTETVPSSSGSTIK